MRARILGLAALTLGVYACGGIRVNTDYNPETDFTSYRTFAWAEGSGSGHDMRVAGDLMDRRFRRAIASELVSRGLEKATSDQPDVFVGYQVALDDRIDYQTINTYYGSGWGYRGVYGGVGASQVTAREYTVGTLVIDVYDASQRELVWRGAGEGRVKQARSPEESQELINQAVTQIMKEFPVG
ncbi:MAG: DUF4136 domain-containing protein [Longimicrobiales bacterium]